MSGVNSSGRRVIIISSIALALLLLSLIYMILPESEGYDLRELPEDFVKAAHGLNMSLEALDRMGNVEVDLRSQSEEMLNLAERLREIHGKMELKGDLGGLLERASIAYSRVAEAASLIDRLTLKLNGSKHKVDRMFALLENCSVAEASSLARELNLSEMVGLADDALSTLNSVNSSDLLSKKHRELLASGIKSVDRVRDMLLELEKVVEILLSEDPSTLSSLCASRKLGLKPNLSGREGLIRKISSLRPDKGFVYSFDISQLKSWLKSLEYGTGQGAGAKYPESDD